LDGNLRHIETTRLEGPIGEIHGFPLGNDVLVFDSRLPNGRDSIATFAIVDSSGKVIRKMDRQPARNYVHNVVAPAASGDFWAIHSNQSLLRRYSKAGELVRSYRISIEHFQPWEGPPDRAGNEGYDVPARPRHFAVIDVGDDLIIILTRFADKDWKSPLLPGGGVNPSMQDSNRQFDTQLSLIDLRNGRAMSTIRVPENLRSVHGASNLFYMTQEDEVGDVVTKVVQVNALRASPASPLPTTRSDIEFRYAHRLTKSDVLGSTMPGNVGIQPY